MKTREGKETNTKKEKKNIMNIKRKKEANKPTSMMKNIRRLKERKNLKKK